MRKKRLGARHFFGIFNRKPQGPKALRTTELLESLESRLLLSTSIIAVGQTPQTVGTSPVDVSVGLSTQAITFGQPVTLTATVNDANPNDPAPTGSIWFHETTHGFAIGPIALNNGSVTLSLSLLDVGADQVSASYLGDAAHAPGTSPAQLLNVAAAPTALTLQASGTGTPTNPPSFAATVTAPDGTAFGNVPPPTFPARPSQPAEAGGTLTIAPPVQSSGNNLTFSSTTFYTGGTWIQGGTIITSGTTNIFSGIASTVSLRIDVGARTVTLTPAGGTVALDLTPTEQPTGRVTFMDGASVLGTANILDNSAVFTPQSLPSGDHTITAYYNGDAGFVGSTSPSIDATVQPDTTTTTLSASNTPATPGSPLTLSFRVRTTQPEVTAPTGTVTIVDGANTLATVDVGGSKTLSDTTLAGGPHQFTAIYSGDANYPGSTSAVFSEMLATPTAISLNDSSSANASGAPITFSASVAPTAAVTNGATPTGNLVFYDGASLLETAPLDSNGTAAITAALSTAAAHHITAYYAGSGDGEFAASTSSPLTIAAAVQTTTQIQTFGPGTPTQAPTLTVMIADQNGNPLQGESWPSPNLPTTTSASGTLNVGVPKAAYPTFNPGNFTGTTDSITSGTFSSITKSGSGSITINSGDYYYPPTPVLPTGTVTFMEGDTILGTATLSAGAAVFSPQNLPLGDHQITAVYSGDALYAASTSQPTTVSIQTNHTTTALTTSLDPVVPGDSFTLNFYVTSTLPDSVSPTGSVTINNGKTKLATVPLGSTQTIKFALPLGVDSLTAAYTGDANFAPSTSPVLFETVGPTVTTVAANQDAIVVGGTATLVATVTAAASLNLAPAGTVVFTDGATPLGTMPITSTTSGYQAVLSVSNLAPGTHHIIATYQGMRGLGGSTSQPFTLGVMQHNDTANLAYLKQLYLDLLRRPLDSTGQTVWLNTLHTGATFQDVAADIVSSREYDGGLINSFYVQYLGRPADTTGLTGWVDLMQAGQNADHIRAGILGSDEYFARAGGTQTTWINSLYNTFLSRDAEPAGLAYWLTQLTPNPATRQQVSAAIATADEALQDTVDSYYQNYLHRPADSSGLNAWMQQLQSGVTEPVIVAAFVTSPEYLARNQIT